MIALDLTEEQKQKLLEMAKTLFPEYKYWNIHDGSCDLCMPNTLDFAEQERPEWNTWKRMHWFEFCFCHLRDKIQKFSTYIYDYDFDIEFLDSCQNSHPVDFLYKDFKSFKSNE